jgi:pilus assembly protein FimV
MDAELDFMADADEVATKLDLARAYMDMGDNEGARDILAEVAHEGNEAQRQEAVDLLGRIDA